MFFDPCPYASTALQTKMALILETRSAGVAHPYLSFTMFCLWQGSAYQYVADTALVH